MPTIISDPRALAFLHIPKTAGTTISRQLRAALPHDPAFAEGWTAHPELGDFYNDHRTLRQIEITAPETLDKIRRYTAIAVCREPVSRFRSALGQYLRNTSGAALADLSRRDLESLVDGVIDGLEAGEIRTLPMAFFRRQSEYIFLDGEQLVETLFDFRRLDALAAFLRREAGVTLDTRTRFRSAGNHAWKHRTRRPVMRFLKPIARRVLPGAVQDRVRTAGIARVKQAADQRLGEVLDAPQRRAFLEAYYESDFALCKRLEIGTGS